VPATLVSDGFGFYIAPLLQAAGLDGVGVVTNTWSPNAQGPIRYDNGHPECVGCGTCKMNAVLAARAGGPVAFVGEGRSDRFAALYADVVFAKDVLVEVARDDGVPFLPWEDFDAGALETLDEPRPVGGEAGWRLLSIELPEGFTSRPATLEDAEAVTAVMAASETHHMGFANIDVDDVLADYTGATDLARDSLLVFEGDRLVAEMLVENGRYANGTVHPDAEGRGSAPRSCAGAGVSRAFRAAPSSVEPFPMPTRPRGRCSRRTGTSRTGSPGSWRSVTTPSPRRRRCLMGSSSGRSSRVRRQPSTR
jgi:hypothetical protein